MNPIPFEETYFGLPTRTKQASTEQIFLIFLTATLAKLNNHLQQMKILSTFFPIHDRV